jgi:hypothetical protein
VGWLAAPQQIFCVIDLPLVPLHAPVDNPAPAISPAVPLDRALAAVESKHFPVMSDLAPAVAEFNAPVVVTIGLAAAVPVPAKAAAVFNDQLDREKAAAEAATVFAPIDLVAAAMAFVPIVLVAVIGPDVRTHDRLGPVKAAAVSSGDRIDRAAATGPTIVRATSTIGISGTTGGRTTVSTSTTTGTVTGTITAGTTGTAAIGGAGIMTWVGIGTIRSTSITGAMPHGQR